MSRRGIVHDPPGNQQMSERVFIIAEAGVNHNGELNLAKQLIDVAAEAGADAVKFQTFRAEQIVSRTAPKAEYQTRTTGQAESQFEMIRKLELTEMDHEALIAHAQARGIAFLSTPFDMPSLRLLTKRFGLQAIKIPSGEITNAPFLLAIARAAQQVILSTGMSTLAEVEAALGVLAFGFTASTSATPQPGGFEQAFASDSGQQTLHARVILLHCTTEYPAPFGEVNLRAMDTLAAAFGLPVGYSDHTPGIHISLAAVARGARMIEKHFTLDRNLPGPDHRASLEPGELRELVHQTREIELALGDGIKRPAPSEWKNRAVVRKSLVAAKAITEGELFTEENLTCKRPGTGMTPFAYWQTLGRIATYNYNADEMLDV
jgi:N-acetylneuraminate synthase